METPTLPTNPELVPPQHEDERRALRTIFNGEFAAGQTLTLEVKSDCYMGGHYHTYGEIFYVYRGRLDYTLINVDSGVKTDVTVREGEKIYLPPRTYHKAFAPAGSVIFGFTEEPFISEEHNNLPYQP